MPKGYEKQKMKILPHWKWELPAKQCPPICQPWAWERIFYLNLVWRAVSVTWCQKSPNWIFIKVKLNFLKHLFDTVMLKTLHTRTTLALWRCIQVLILKQSNLVNINNVLLKYLLWLQRFRSNTIFDHRYFGQTTTLPTDRLTRDTFPSQIFCPSTHFGHQ